jgi:hypothetical protein
MAFSGPGPGRPKGTPHKIPAKIKELCLKAAPEVIAELKRLMLDKNRLAAAMPSSTEASAKPRSQ